MFSLTPSEMARVSAWASEQNAIVIAKQQASGDECDIANYGAIGGELTYMFTPTGLGTVIKVVHAVTKAELDLTDYESW